ncbi:MAG: thiol-disulfide oxidoreductase DCC family protein [Bacteroidales bacterium]|nr:thiol-disulfide oxidoreductase DCC family protein [Bacteroidales bacterium]
MNEKIVRILLFDGVCNLCNGSVHFILKRDKQEKFKFAALQSESGQILLKKYNLSNIQFDSLVYILDENYYLKSDAVLRIFRTLGGFWKLMWIFHYLPRCFRDFIYDLIAKSRYRVFGKREECMIPTPSLKKRFL